MSSCNGWWLYGDPTGANNHGRTAVRMHTIDLGAYTGVNTPKYPSGFAESPEEVLEWLRPTEVEVSKVPVGVKKKHE